MLIDESWKKLNMWSKKTGGLSRKTLETFFVLAVSPQQEPLLRRHRESLFTCFNKKMIKHVQRKTINKQFLHFRFAAVCAGSKEASIKKERRNYAAAASPLHSITLMRCRRESLEFVTQANESDAERLVGKYFSLNANQQRPKRKKVSLTRSSVNFVEWKRSIVGRAEWKNVGRNFCEGKIICE